MLTDPYRQYRQNQVGTASPARLMMMLYNEAIKSTVRAREGIEGQHMELANAHLGRTQDIIAELMASLDLSQGEIPESLFQLYRYMNDQLVQANIQKDTAPVGEVQKMLEELRDTFKAASQLV